MLISEALSEFLTYHQAKGSRPRTMLWYEKTATYLLRDYLEREIAELTVFLINKVLSKQVKPNTLSNYDRALRGFCNWLYDCELLQKASVKGSRMNSSPSRCLPLLKSPSCWKLQR